jgi:hypothetical protein
VHPEKNSTPEERGPLENPRILPDFLDFPRKLLASNVG